MNTEREAFEKFYFLHYNGSEPSFQIAESGGAYVYRHVQEAWEFWQAATASLHTRIEELEAQASVARNEALEQAADAISQSIESIGDQHSYNGTDLTCCEQEKIATVIWCENIIRALKAGDVQAPKEGWKLVPPDATYEMRMAAYWVANHDIPPSSVTDDVRLRAVYKAMIAAAPTDTEGK